MSPGSTKYSRRRNETYRNLSVSTTNLCKARKGLWEGRDTFRNFGNFIGTYFGGSSFLDIPVQKVLFDFNWGKVMFIHTCTLFIYVCMYVFASQFTFEVTLLWPSLEKLGHYIVLTACMIGFSVLQGYKMHPDVCIYVSNYNVYLIRFKTRFNYK